MMAHGANGADELTRQLKRKSHLTKPPSHETSTNKKGHQNGRPFQIGD